MATKNPCGKMRPADKPYEIWQNDRPFSLGGDVQEIGSWKWYVLKKYQSPELEEKNEYARWMCNVVTPMCPDGEMGDVYVSDIKPWAKKIFSEEEGWIK